MLFCSLYSYNYLFLYILSFRLFLLRLAFYFISILKLPGEKYSFQQNINLFDVKGMNDRYIGR